MKLPLITFEMTEPALLCQSCQTKLIEKVPKYTYTIPLLSISYLYFSVQISYICTYEKEK